MRNTGLQSNATKYSLGLKEITYLCCVITKEGIKPNQMKVQGIMDLEQPTTTTEARALIGMVHYYRGIWPRQSQILDPMTEAANGPKVRKIIWNDALEESFKELNHIVYTETLLSYSDWKITFTVHTNASDKHLGDVIIQNNKTIILLSMMLIKLQRNYTTNEKELLAIVECLNEFQGIPFGYEINVFHIIRLWSMLQP